LNLFLVPTVPRNFEHFFPTALPTTIIKHQEEVFTGASLSEHTEVGADDGAAEHEHVSQVMYLDMQNWLLMG